MERCARPDRRLRLVSPLLVLFASLGACASKKPPAVRAVKPLPQDQKLAWMPVDPLDAPSIAKAVNEQMSRVKVAGTKEHVKAAVSMEVAQLAIECIQPTTICYRAVGHSLGADQLMWAEVDPAAPADKIRITVVLFDVQSGNASRRVGTYDGVPAARAGVAELVDHAASGGSRSP
ncbi:MAG TPA: hypothetical protein VKQ32_17780 [Polyangia bacterium]|nr:hypothetical protein [Polyangia bacterium]